MACLQFNPDIPHDTITDQGIWLSKWHSDVVNNVCLQNFCALQCVGGEFTSSACRNCLKQYDCSSAYKCSRCVPNITNFKDVYNCSISHMLKWWEIIFIILGCILVLFTIFFVTSLALIKYVPNSIKIRLQKYVP